MFVPQTRRDITVRSLIQKVTSNPVGKRVMKTVTAGQFKSESLDVAAP